MRSRLNPPVLGLLLSCAVVACGAGAGQPDAAATPQPQASDQKAVNPDAALVKDFNDRVKKYMSLHDTKETGSAELKETDQPEKIKAAQDALAARIQAARSDAKHGDIFTPEIRQLFRRLMYPELKGPDAAQTKQAIKEDAPPPAKAKQALKVNGRYPEGTPLPTVPANLLTRLPQLPEGLEYRILNKDLILRDVNANLVVDFIPNAIR